MTKLCPIKDCTGCGACLNVCNHKAIQMIEDSEGFYYPIINESICTSCGLCTNVCPQINLNVKFRNEIQTCYAGYALDNHIRCNSSSGGVFSVIADYVLRNKGKVIGASLNEKDRKLSHIIISRKEDISQLRVSKYFQSNTGNIFKEIKAELKKGREILFCGTPCQVAGLKQYLQHTDTSRLILCDFVCHGVPSYKVFEKMIKECDIKGQIYFRNIRGWSIGFYEEIKCLVGYILKPRKNKESFYFHSYLSGYMNRECCYQCPYTNSKRTGDITLADYWGIKEMKPLTKRKMIKGVSFVGINTLKGKKYLEAISSQLFLQKRDLNEAMQNNDQFNHPTMRPNERSDFYENLSNMSWDDLLEYYNYSIRKSSLRDKLQTLKGILYSYTTK